MKKVIVVGAGNWGKNLVRNFNALGALAGVAEMNPALRAKVAADFPEVKIYDDLASALATDVDAVVLATPAPSHYPLALQVLQSGKDVFIEKPMTLKTSEARKLAEYADSQDLVLMVGHLLLYQPAIAWMHDYLATGKAGKVFHVSTQRVKLGKVRSTENVWWSFAPHDVSVILDLLGNPSSELQLQSVQSSGHAMLQANIADNVHVDLKFTNGQSAHIHTSWYYPLSQRSTVVLAEKQMLVYDEVAQTVTIHNKTIDSDLNNRDDGTETVKIAAAEPLKLECEHFLECLATRQRPRSDGWNGVGVVEILEKAHKGLETKT
ncbi:Gfo/Idh/MocA family protein [[Limnothrix rosea] IAM M-220]|uniref:Gfo/Idh/MocA family protein n=1 Tax=[Limnothrix rosea] IAM M-220 TaxID=454133 RepID=UPI00096924B2|nr:Gfo/Idh/MocA family oxidoreductase [[Limnothrix rosea] IAM M-220]OKH13843.1 oxidoreductase [[Limnothrix rosea] IAM M-220]